MKFIIMFFCRIWNSDSVPKIKIYRRFPEKIYEYSRILVKITGETGKHLHIHTNPRAARAYRTIVQQYIRRLHDKATAAPLRKSSPNDVSSGDSDGATFLLSLLERPTCFKRCSCC